MADVHNEEVIILAQKDTELTNTTRAWKQTKIWLEKQICNRESAESWAEYQADNTEGVLY